MESSAEPRTTKGRSSFIASFTLILAFLLIFGFARTFYLQPVFAAKPLNFPLIVHGICGTCWFALLAWQAQLVRRGRLARHRTLGQRVGPALAITAVLSALWIVSLTALDGKAAGSGLPDKAALFIQLGTTIWFAVLAILGFRSTKRPDYHKRYMIMATIAMLAPAFSRIARLAGTGKFPVDSAFLAAPLIAALFVNDFRTLKRAHPVTIWAGLGYLAYVAVRVPIAKSQAWNEVIVPALFGS